MPTKAELRRTAREQRRALLPENRRRQSEAVCRLLQSSKVYQSAGVLLGYLAAGEELSVDALLWEAVRAGKALYLPRCLNDAGEMAFYRVSSPKEIERGMFGICEPIAGLPQYDPQQAALLLVPGICFDHVGYRLGYGKGYYDRFLPKTNAFSVGICYNELRVPALPVGAWDVPVSALCTEAGGLQILVSH